MAKLTYKRRLWLAQHHPELFAERPTKDNPLGGYPMDTAKRTRSALRYGARFASPKVRAKICRMVARRFPEVHASSCSMHDGSIRRKGEREKMF